MQTRVNKPRETEMNTPPWFTVAIALVLVASLAACKSRPRNAGCTNCAPTIAQPSYPPPSPSYYPAEPPDAVPSASASELAAARDREELARNRSADLERQLRLEQDRLARTEGRLREVEEKLSDMDAPPTHPVPSPALDGPGPSDEAMRLADDLRARSAADVIRDGNMVVVRVTDGFRAGQDLLKQDVQLVQTLNATADALTRYPGATIAIVGHADLDPIKKSRWGSNDELSMARAQRVAQVLADNGVDRNRMSVDGRGSREPLVAPERSSGDKARNRRVEIMIRP